MNGRHADTVDPSQIRVLVADDDRERRDLTADILNRAGCRVEFDTATPDREPAHAPEVVVASSEAALQWFVDGLLALPFEQFAYAILLCPESRLHREFDHFAIFGFDDVVALPFSPRSLLQRVLTGARVARRERRLQCELRTDPVTRLPNRRACDEAIDRVWSESCSTGARGVCAMIDIDRFKLVNDAHGHVAGDELLKAIGTTLAELCTQGEFVGRYGGDEFLVLFGPRSSAEAVRLTERIVVAVQDLHAKSGGVSATVTAGLAEWAPDMPTSAAWLERADERLRTGKASGRNRVMGPPIPRSDGSD